MELPHLTGRQKPPEKSTRDLGPQNWAQKTDQDIESAF
jgi:hypothetical protein